MKKEYKQLSDKYRDQFKRVLFYLREGDGNSRWILSTKKIQEIRKLWNTMTPFNFSRMCENKETFSVAGDLGNKQNLLYLYLLPYASMGFRLNKSIYNKEGKVIDMALQEEYKKQCQKNLMGKVGEINGFFREILKLHSQIVAVKKNIRGEKLKSRNVCALIKTYNDFKYYVGQQERRGLNITYHKYLLKYSLQAILQGGNKILQGKTKAIRDRNIGQLKQDLKSLIEADVDFVLKTDCILGQMVAKNVGAELQLTSVEVFMLPEAFYLNLAQEEDESLRILKLHRSPEKLTNFLQKDPAIIQSIGKLFKKHECIAEIYGESFKEAEQILLSLNEQRDNSKRRGKTAEKAITKCEEESFELTDEDRLLSLLDENREKLVEALKEDHIIIRSIIKLFTEKAYIGGIYNRDFKVALEEFLKADLERSRWKKFSQRHALRTTKRAIVDYYAGRELTFFSNLSEEARQRLFSNSENVSKMVQEQLTRNLGDDHVSIANVKFFKKQVGKGSNGFEKKVRPDLLKISKS